MFAQFALTVRENVAVCVCVCVCVHVCMCVFVQQGGAMGPAEMREFKSQVLIPLDI